MSRSAILLDLKVIHGDAGLGDLDVQAASLHPSPSLLLRVAHAIRHVGVFDRHVQPPAANPKPSHYLGPHTSPGT